ncbi:MAG: carbohydrate-binding family 9-like protein [Bacteroidota bacterium]
MIQRITFWLLMIPAFLVSISLKGNDGVESSKYWEDDQAVPEFSPRTYVCYHRSGAIEIDGKLDEKAWSEIPWTSSFEDIRGEGWAEPEHDTRVKMMWDDEYFYVAAKLEEPHIWATIEERDAVIFHDNDFEVFIDPDGDTHGYYELELNALNTIWDLLLVRPYRDGGPAIDNWDINGLRTAVHVDGSLNDPEDRDNSWSVEIAFPLSALEEFGKGVRPGDGVQWRVNFSRVQWQTSIANGEYRKKTDPETGNPLPEENWVWSPQGVVDMHRPETWGVVQFSRKLAGKGEADFNFDPAENIKWELRNLYFAQRRFRAENDRYARSIDELEQVGFIPAALEFDPEMKTGFQTYEIRARGENLYWHINNEGRTWSSRREE